MNRRRFLELTATAGAWVASGSITRARAAGGAPDLVAVKGGAPDAMFDRGIEALGGMKAFVKKGQKVLVKPNIGWAVSPDRAGNTNPRLVARIVEQALAAGASAVYVFDNSCDLWTHAYRESGIEAAARAAGAKVAPGGGDGAFQRVEVKGQSLKEARVHELLLEADVFVDVPVLKSHGSTTLTIGMKNLMGVVEDRGYWHANDLNRCIVDMTAWRKPDLTVVDAFNVMTRNGPRGVSAADVVQPRAQLLSRDIVAADAAAAKLFGLDPASVTHVALAAKAGLGRMDLAALDIRRITI